MAALAVLGGRAIIETDHPTQLEVARLQQQRLPQSSPARVAALLWAPPLQLGHLGQGQAVAEQEGRRRAPTLRAGLLREPLQPLQTCRRRRFLRVTLQVALAAPVGAEQRPCQLEIRETR